MRSPRHCTSPASTRFVRAERAISADTALRLGRYFGLPAQFWLNLQNDYDLRVASRNGAAERIKLRTQAAGLASAARLGRGLAFRKRPFPPRPAGVSASESKSPPYLRKKRGDKDGAPA